VNEKGKVLMLGLSFIACLALAYVENIFFFQSTGNIFAIPLTAIIVLFSHNVLAVSLIILGMTFYVRYVLTFLPKEKFGYIVLQHPRLFAFIFTVMILAISILRANTLLRVEFLVNTILIILLLSIPQGVLEGYAIFLAINKTLEKKMTRKNLVTIYSLFLLAAILEVSFIQILLATLAK